MLSYLNESIELKIIKPIYTHMKYDSSNTFLSAKKIFTLYEAYPFPKASRILLIDKKDLVLGSKFKYSLRKLDENEISEIIREIKTNPIEKERLEKHLKIPLSSSVLYGKIFEPSFRLKDDFDITQINWNDFVHNVISYKAKKDERILLIFKATLLRGFKITYSPHTILATDVSVGKTEFYERAGKRFDKITANTLIGYTSGKDEVYEGVISNQVYPICLEQIESQAYGKLLNYLINFMETGHATAGSGGIEMNMIGSSPIIITANPVGYDVSHSESFKFLLEKLSENQLALGRRIGLLVFGFGFKPVEKLGVIKTGEWESYFELYRAIEEKCSRLINDAIYNNDKFLNWLEMTIDNYNKSILQAYKIDDASVKDFLESHLEYGFRHLKGGALSCAIIDAFPELLNFSQVDAVSLPENLEQKIISNAEEVLKKLIAINVGSISSLVNEFGSSLKFEQKMFDAMPNTLKELILAVKEYKKQSKFEMKISVQDLLSNYLQKRYVVTAEKVIEGLDEANVYKSFMNNHFGFFVDNGVIIITSKREIQIAP